jgi:hypothetical protein
VEVPRLVRDALRPRPPRVPGEFADLFATGFMLLELLFHRMSR